MRRNEKNIRDDFTDALNEEILLRKTFDKAKRPPRQEEEIFTAEEKAEIISEPEFSGEKIYPNFVPAKQKKIVEEEKISQEKKSSPPETKISQEVKADTELEKRIFVEAENDFYEEKTPEVKKIFHSKIVDEKETERPIFRSKNLKSDVIEDEKKSDDDLDFDPELYRKLTRAEMSGVALSTLMLIYAFVNFDKPLFFLALSLMIHLIRPPIGAFFGKHNRAVQNAMRSFSIVLFLGAILFIFL
ncbi:MAG: hypothetical protein IJU55_05035 [Selenomonadaceae bacterium]|nr:hypothetical protein [Selenomonadaceae bacterium]